MVIISLISRWVFGESVESFSTQQLQVQDVTVLSSTCVVACVAETLSQGNVKQVKRRRSNKNIFFIWVPFFYMYSIHKPWKRKGQSILSFS